jgi:hypothetical protein
MPTSTAQSDICRARVGLRRMGSYGSNCDLEFFWNSMVSTWLSFGLQNVKKGLLSCFCFDEWETAYSPSNRKRPELGIVSHIKEAKNMHAGQGQTAWVALASCMISPLRLKGMYTQLQGQELGHSYIAKRGNAAFESCLRCNKSSRLLWKKGFIK